MSASWGLRHRTIFGFWLGLQLLPRECSTYFRGVLEDFLGIPPFQLCFEVTCSHFWGLRNLFLHFWVWLGTSTVFPQCFDGFIVDASISAQPLLGVAPCIPRFWGLVGFTAVHTGMEHLFP
jgi:hypothetical protein